MKLTEKQIESLISISYEAGKAIMEVYAQTDLGIQEKADKSPLTRADMAANEIICNHLKNLTPDIPIISEEADMPPYEIRKNYERYWLIDPLDGTKEFIRKNGEFTTNIALIENGVPVAGFVFVPARKDMYWAVLGGGAHKIVEEKTEQISVRKWDPKSKDVVVTCSRSHLNDDTLFYINQLVDPDLMKVGSSLKIVLIAEGNADVYPRLGHISEWDVAASHIILTEAGGSIYQYPSRSLVRYNNENILMPHFVAEGERV